MKSESETMKHVILLLLTPAFAIWGGFAVSTFWGWHIESIVNIHLGVLQAVGVSMMMTHLTGNGTAIYEDAIAEKLEVDNDKLLLSRVLAIILRPGILLLFGLGLKAIQ